MDFSHLHTYTPPQHAPDNTGYTYSLSSSYCTAALDFEAKHKIDPVYDSPRMSRRSLRLATNYHISDDAELDAGNLNSSVGNFSSYKEKTTKAVKQRSTSKQLSTTQEYSKALSSSSALSQSSFASHVSDLSMASTSTVLDESSIQERTEVDHFWDNADRTVILPNGDIISSGTQTSMVNGYTCENCSMLSQRKDALTTYSSMHTAPSVVYSRTKTKTTKSGGLHYYASRVLHVSKYAASSLVSLFVQFFQTVSLKLGYKSKAHSSYCGSMNINELHNKESHLGLNGESLCDDCKEKKHHETHTTVHIQSSRSKRVARTMWHIFSYTGYFLLQAVKSVSSVGWFVTRKLLSFLWLTIVSPGKAASGALWWLGTGWYQLVAFVSLLNVFLLTRCLPRILKFLLLILIPLLLWLGLWYLYPAELLSLLPFLNGTEIQAVPLPDEASVTPKIDPAIFGHGDSERSGQDFDVSRLAQLEKQVAVLSDSCQKSGLHNDERYNQVMVLLKQLQQQLEQMNSKDGISLLITNAVTQQIEELKQPKYVSETDYEAFRKAYESQITEMERLVKQLSARSEELQMQFEASKSGTISGGSDERSQHLISEIKRLEQELDAIKLEVLTMQSRMSSCDKVNNLQETVNTQVKESVKLLFFDENEKDVRESLLQWLSSYFVSKTDFHTVLQNLEMRILKNISFYRTHLRDVPAVSVVTDSAASVGLAGITEQQAHMIVNNALKLYSQDRTGMVDYAMESGGGSVLSTRCSETYETKTALMSLFGVPLWYFSQSPRVVIQPEVYPGNCWAFKGSQGYLVVRLSMMIFPSAFTLEHIPKNLSPTGNISSAPKEFTVYGLEDEHQEEGVLLGQYMYDEKGEALQTFDVKEENDKAFQIVELRVLSNWGHPEYTCLYRFRVHGVPVKNEDL
ncbi:SUN domain-containing protein 1 isoform X2 [Protopterus annectens]|uniref:SUN domain-containing protein 1 isoform X2 n=1 Tax=Protopterus annectens TaxID=7888 RepID=UPI001CFA685A|nr:SUN domain-containing protein 1 isoform X2 [Protopterus annectens]